jgi:predicted transposase/invertase (TIGR01784 family)
LKTDSIFYKIFQTAPGLFFELIGLPKQLGQSYEFRSVEIKQTAFRIDGVFLPRHDAYEQTVWFVEVQVRFVCPKGGKPLRMGNMGSYL